MIFQNTQLTKFSCSLYTLLCSDCALETASSTTFILKFCPQTLLKNRIRIHWSKRPRRQLIFVWITVPSGLFPINNSAQRNFKTEQQLVLSETRRTRNHVSPPSSNSLQQTPSLHRQNHFLPRPFTSTPIENPISEVTARRTRNNEHPSRVSPTRLQNYSLTFFGELSRAFRTRRAPPFVRPLPLAPFSNHWMNGDVPKVCGGACAPKRSRKLHFSG